MYLCSDGAAHHVPMRPLAGSATCTSTITRGISSLSGSKICLSETMLRFAHQKVIQELGSLCYLCLRHGKWSPFFRAKRDALRLLPVMLKKRAKIQSGRRVSNRYWRSVLTSMFTLAFFRLKLKQLIKEYSRSSVAFFLAEPICKFRGKSKEFRRGKSGESR